MSTACMFQPLCVRASRPDNQTITCTTTAESVTLKHPGWWKQSSTTHFLFRSYDITLHSWWYAEANTPLLWGIWIGIYRKWYLLLSAGTWRAQHKSEITTYWTYIEIKMSNPLTPILSIITTQIPGTHQHLFRNLVRRGVLSRNRLFPEGLLWHKEMDHVNPKSSDMRFPHDNEIEAAPWDVVGH